MSHGALILLTHEQLQCWQPQGRQWQAMADMTQLAPGTAVTVVCDLANEHCQRLQLPPLTKRHRQTLLARQLKQQFPQSRWRTALPGLARPRFTRLGWPAEALDFSLFGMDDTPALQAMEQQAQLRWIALYPLGLLVLGLLPRQGVQKWQLVVVSHARQLRILALDQGVLVVNRQLTDVCEPSAQWHEVERTRRYLESQFGLAQAHNCQLLWLGARQDALSQLDATRYELLPVADEWQVPGASFSASQLHELIRRAPAGAQLITEKATGTHPWRQPLNWATAASLLLGSSSLTWLQWQRLEAERHIDAQQRQLAQLRQQQSAFESELSRQPMTVAQLQQLQAWQARSHATAATIAQHLSQLAQRLQLDQHRRVQSLVWQASGTGCAADNSSTTLQADNASAASQETARFAELRFSLMLVKEPTTDPQPADAPATKPMIRAPRAEQALAFAGHAAAQPQHGCLNLPLAQELAP